MSVLIWLAANIVMIMFIILAIKEKDPEAKKKKRLVWVISLAVGFIMFIIIGASGSKEKKTTVDKEEPVIQDEASTDSLPIQESEKAELPEKDTNNSDGLTADIVAGELGEYGQELVLNKGTEFEDVTVGYFVPSGVYEVTNIGDKRCQVNVYKNETKEVDGWEEWADTTVELLDVNETKEMSVPEGYFFNMDPPAHISVKQLNSETKSIAADNEELREAFNDSLGDTTPLWYDSVRNDVTGNWRELVIYSDKEVDGQMAIDYANAYVKTDDEIHFVVNLYLKTTTRINKMGNMLYVTTLKYKDGEEHDAKELGGGDLLKSFSVNIDTGEVEVF